MVANKSLNSELFASYFKEQNVKSLTDIQIKSIPLLLEDKNLVIFAKTGSGKTLSYLLPIFQNLKLREDKARIKKGSPRAIIILPIKELAIQIHDVAKEITHHVKQRVRIAIGGTKGKRVQSLKSQEFDLLVTTPGRIKSMLIRKELTLECLEYLIIDEADQLMDMGFSLEIKEIKKYVNEKTIIGLYSATMGPDFNQLVQDVFKGTHFETISTQTTVNIIQTIETYNINLSYQEKNSMLELFIKKESKGSGIIFINQKDTMKTVFLFLKEKFPSKKIYSLSGEMTVQERQDNFNRFKNTGGVLISTDILARGIDIKKLVWILNYDLPFEAIYYIHRSGRVGRMGRAGKVFNFITQKDQKLIKLINNAIKEQATLKIDPILSQEKKMPATKYKKQTIKNTSTSQPKKRSHSKLKKSPRYKKKK